MRRRVRYGLSALAGVALAAGAVATAATAIPGHQNNNDPLQALSGTLQTLTGSLPNWAHPDEVVGALNPNQKLPIQLALPLRNESQAQDLVNQMSDPSSPNYGKYLSAADFNKQFAPTQDQVNKVSSWMSEQGLQVSGSPDPNNHYVNATGTVSQLQKAFGTTLKQFKVGDKILKAPTSPVKLPADIAKNVQTVLGLADTFTTTPSLNRTPEPATPHGAGAAPSVGHDASCQFDQYWGQTALRDPSPLRKQESNWLCPYSPAQIRSAYGLRGSTGAGQTVAIVDAYDSVSLSADANRYSTKYGLPQLTSKNFIHKHKHQTNVSQCAGNGAAHWAAEQALDIDAVHTAAPSARILYYGAANCVDLFSPLNTIIANKSASIISNSWSADRADSLTSGEVKSYNNVLLQAAAEGIGVYFATGDAGDETITPTSGYKRAAKPQTWFPASSPYATAVGGTTLGIGANGQRVFETGWESRYDQLNTSTNKWSPYTSNSDYPKGFTGGAGGGVAPGFTTPSWQKGVVGKAYSRGYRTTPDVSALGDWNTGFVVGFTPRKDNGSSDGSYSEDGYGGTSLATPLIAGIVADAQHVQHRNLGFLNPALYKARGSSKLIDVSHVDSAEFGGQYDNYPNSPTLLVDNDIKTGSLQSHAGWDAVTGVGVPNGATFLKGIGK